MPQHWAALCHFERHELGGKFIFTPVGPIERQIGVEPVAVVGGHPAFFDCERYRIRARYFVTEVRGQCGGASPRVTGAPGDACRSVVPSGYSPRIAASWIAAKAGCETCRSSNQTSGTPALASSRWVSAALGMRRAGASGWRSPLPLRHIPFDGMQAECTVGQVGDADVLPCGRRFVTSAGLVRAWAPETAWASSFGRARSLRRGECLPCRSRCR